MGELQVAWRQPDGSVTVKGDTLGAPGDDLALLAVIDLDATTGADAFEVTDGGDYVATVAGTNYVVQFATVRVAEDGRVDDKLAFVGVATAYTPGGAAAEAEAADAEAKAKAEAKAEREREPEAKAEPEP